MEIIKATKNDIETLMKIRMEMLKEVTAFQTITFSTSHSLKTAE